MLTELWCFWCLSRAEKAQLQRTQVCNKMHQKQNKPCWRSTWFMRNSLFPGSTCFFSYPFLFFLCTFLIPFWPSVVLNPELFVLSIILLQMLDGEVTGLTVLVFQAHTHRPLTDCVVVKTSWRLVIRHLNHIRAGTEIPVLGRVTKSTHWMPGFVFTLLLWDVQ